MKRPYIILSIAVFLFGVVFLSVLFFPNKRTTPLTNLPKSSAQTLEEAPFPIASGEIIKPPKMKELDYIPPDKGGGIDVNSTKVLNSKNEINKLVRSLPLQKTLKSSTEKEVQIIIPAKELQLNTWTLTVQIFDIDYQLDKNSMDYIISRQTFLEATDYIFSWMKSFGANPEEIIISWGDKEFIQTQAEEWLDSR